jgi:hypothetical protein
MIQGHDYTIYGSGPGGRARMYALLALITAFVTPLAQHGLLFLLRRVWGDDWAVAETALFFGGFTALVLFGLMLNLFDNFIWRTGFGWLMYRMAGLSAPPRLYGEYRGTIELHPAAGGGEVYRTAYTLRIAQRWERMSLLAERESEAGGTVRTSSDMASVRVGMFDGMATVRFVYTFDETLPRREGVGVMARQFSGAATFEFRRAGDGWTVSGHFFDDIGRSGQVQLAQVPVGTTPPPG